MTKAGSAGRKTPRTAVQIALDAPDVRQGLDRHATARLAVLLADRPAAVRDEVARDAVQEASQRALAEEERFDETLAPAVAWLHGILERVLHEHCRMLRKQPAQPCTDPGSWNELEARLAAPDHRPTLERLLATLPVEQRRIVSMHHLDGLAHEQIAETLGISVGCSRVRLARAMAELKRSAAREDLR